MEFAVRSEPFFPVPGFSAGTSRCSGSVPSPLYVSGTVDPASVPAEISAGETDEDPILPDIPDDVVKTCLALVPRSDFPSVAAVCKKWRSFLRSKEFVMARRLEGLAEEWIYLLVADANGRDSRWEVLDRLGQKQRQPPPMPCSSKSGFGVVARDGKLFIVGGGYADANGIRSASPEVYQYDPCLNCWRKLASMNVARYDFACAEVNGMIYAVGGYGANGECLSSAETYDPDTNKWTVTEPLRRPRWGSFGCGFGNKLYVMGGRSSFSIGNSRSVDVYDARNNEWCEVKKGGCVMVTSHAVIGRRLFCIEWKDQRKLAVFDSADGSWKAATIPLAGSLNVEFRLGILGGKLLLLQHKQTPWYSTLVYDPEAASGSEWRTCPIRPSGWCRLSITIEA